MGLPPTIVDCERQLIKEWREKALCKGLNLEGWKALPKSLCFECPVRKECLWEAISNDDHQISHDYFLGGNQRVTKYGYQPYLTRGGIMAPERKRMYNLCNKDPEKTYEILVRLHFNNGR